MDDDFDYEDDLTPISDLDLQQGIKDWERVVMGGAGMLGIIPENKFERAMIDPEDRFKIYIDAISRKLSNIDNVEISETNIEKMIDKVTEVNKIAFKNPTSYVLGFLASGGGRKLNINDYNFVVKKVLPYVEDTSVLPPDIIRYSLLWENL